jgi:hypothetical protein
MRFNEKRQNGLESDVICSIDSYRNDTTLAKPLFVAVDEYVELRHALAAKGGAEIRLSDFCRADNEEPDFDALLTRLRDECGFAFVLGLGEYLALAGNVKAHAELARVKDLTLGDGAKIVALLRGCCDVLNDFCSDPRFMERQMLLIQESSHSFSVTTISLKLGIAGAEWLKAALREMENGGIEDIQIKTDLEFPNATIPVRRIRNAYQALETDWPGLEACGTEEDWAELLGGSCRDPIGCDRSHSFREFLELKRDKSANGYLAFAASRCVKFVDFQREKQHALLDMQPQDPRFQAFYNERKALLKDTPDAEIAGYVARTKIKGEQRIRYLTDNTGIERKAVIECLDGAPKLPTLSMYPALADYLRDFDCDLWTDYFRRYKRQKVSNRIEDGWLDLVKDAATKRSYNRLPTRDGVIDQLPDKAHTALIFVDALGVEFLGFIQARCAALGLRLEVTLARANLPSLTRLNCKFYDDWTGKKFESRELDKLKHEGATGGFDCVQNKLPVHLVQELEIVEDAVNRAKTELASGGSRKVVIASDHGASRLVVVNGQELKYEVNNKGTHSGRCCAVCKLPDDLYSATEENGWLVLADYGRFKGGRAAAVEVHGGATNEEVIVPVIELSLWNNAIEISLVDHKIKANYKTPAAITLFSKDLLDAVSIVVNGRQYKAETLDGNRHRVTMPDICKAGDYAAEVYEGANLIGSVCFAVESGAAQENDLF